jgi:hypothetical protein
MTSVAALVPAVSPFALLAGCVWPQLLPSRPSERLAWLNDAAVSLSTPNALHTISASVGPDLSSGSSSVQLKRMWSTKSAVGYKDPGIVENCQPATQLKADCEPFGVTLDHRSVLASPASTSWERARCRKRICACCHDTHAGFGLAAPRCRFGGSRPTGTPTRAGDARRRARQSWPVVEHAER